MKSSLLALSNDIASLAEQIGPAVVAIHDGRRRSSSGIHWRKNLIVTTEHTIRQSEEVNLTIDRGRTVKASVVGRDSGTDIAVLRSETDIPVVESTLQEPRVGELAMVVGRSPNSGPNVAFGIVSAVSGPWRTWRGGALGHYIRLDATLFDGSAGGAVVDANGHVIGVATDALSRVAALAIPSENVNRIIDVLLEKGSVPQAYLGVGLQPVRLPESFIRDLALENTTGTMVLSLDKNGPAEKAGILVGDILFEIDGKPMEDLGDIQSLLGWQSVGAALKARLIRGGELKEAVISVGERGGRG